MATKRGWDEALRRIEEVARSGSRSLDLKNLELEELPAELFNLTDLTILTLAFNQLTRVSGDIGQLANLRYLYLYDNRLTALPESLGLLAELTYLAVSGNQLTELPESIGRLTKLQILYVGDNRLTVLPKALAGLTNLVRFSAPSNQFTVLPDFLGQLPKLENLSVAGNPLTFPPPEIVSQGTKAILEYLRAAAARTIRRRVAKMVLVGEPKAGKTTLFRVLSGKPARTDEDQTHGIKVEVLKLPHPAGGESMQLNTWDFGGQHIYHATHQFFLTDGALFVLVWNSREGVEKGRLTYWLDMIAARAPSSPILLVSTGLDQSPPDIDLDPLRANYRIVEHLAVSCTKPTGISELQKKIAELASGLRMMEEQWPPDWVKGAEAIRSLGKQHVQPEELFQTMTQSGVAGEMHQTLAGWLRELGDIVYHGDDSPLGGLVVLQPEWVVGEISRVLDSTAVRERRGILHGSDLRSLWPGIQRGVRDHLLRLMDHYDLTYNTEDPDEIGIVVECLQHAPTDYRPDWDAAAGQPEVSMRLQFRCELPPGIPTWFIAREHRFTTHNQWRDGALFKNGETLCLIQTTRESREVLLSVRGPQAAFFFGVMLDGLDQTLDHYKGLANKLERFVPCPISGCKGEFDYLDLRNALERLGPNHTMQCRKCYENIPLARLLFAIPAPEVVARLQAIEQKIDRGFAEVTRQFTLQLKRAWNERDNDCPGVFTLYPRSGLDVLSTTLEAWLASLRGESVEMELCLFCEFHGEWHPTADSVYHFKRDADWLADVAPYWKKVSGVVKFVPHAKEAVESADKILRLETRRHSELSETIDPRYAPDLTWGPARIRLRELLRELDKQRKDPATHWGGLNQVSTPEGEVLWVCPEHKSQIFPNPRQPLE
jgi:internalin A